MKKSSFQIMRFLFFWFFTGQFNSSLYSTDKRKDYREDCCKSVCQLFLTRPYIRNAIHSLTSHFKELIPINTSHTCNSSHSSCFVCYELDLNTLLSAAWTCADRHLNILWRTKSGLLVLITFQCLMNLHICMRWESKWLWHHVRPEEIWLMCFHFVFLHLFRVGM